MNLVFPNPHVHRRLHDGPLGSYVDSYAAEIRAKGDARHSAMLQIGLIADFSRWLAKRRVNVHKMTAGHSRGSRDASSGRAGRL
ncbi:MAG: hypothetical protein ABSH20_03460 [Tepidisphaeraceae bacterium]|jgi:hypothetical protein